MSTPSSGSPAVSSPTPRSDWSPGSMRSAYGADALRRRYVAGEGLRAGGQLLGARLEVVGQIIQRVGDRLLHHRVGNGQLGLDVEIDGQQRRRPDRHHGELLLLLLEELALLQHRVDLVFAGVVDGGDERARLALDRKSVV